MIAKRTGNRELKKAQPGAIVIVPMGGYLPVAIELKSRTTDSEGQIIGTGVVVKRDGCAAGWHSEIGDTVSICLGWTK